MTILQTSLVTQADTTATPFNNDAPALRIGDPARTNYGEGVTIHCNTRAQAEFIAAAFNAAMGQPYDTDAMLATLADSFDRTMMTADHEADLGQALYEVLSAVPMAEGGHLERLLKALDAEIVRLAADRAADDRAETPGQVVSLRGGID